jgi:guanylate kinase
MTLLVLVGPAGVGKGTVVQEILKTQPDFMLSVSATTRSPRPGEQDGTHYHFVTKNDFEEMISAGQLLEWAQVHGDHYYGTPRSELERAASEAKHLILEIDLQGARQVASKHEDQLQVFLLPPGWDELERRLRNRATETEEQIQTRLSTARQELAAAGEFRHQLVNDSVQGTAAEIVGLVREHERGS